MIVFVMQAQVPQGFNYQAVVRGDDGQVLSNQENILITVELREAGSIVYVEEHLVATDQYGLFSIVIGQGYWFTGSDVFEDVDWSSGDDYFIEIFFNGSSLGQKQLWSVPFAMHSLNPGPQGEQGPAGVDGQDGTQGIQGPAGNDGADGLDGDQGEQGLAGVSRWLGRVWNLVLGQGARERQPRQGVYKDVEGELRRRMHQLIRRVGDDIDALKFNTMVSALMEFTNFLIEIDDEDIRTSGAWQEALEAFLILLAPSAVFLAEELWARLGHTNSVHEQEWPVWDANVAADDTFTLVVQVNGKVRERIEASTAIDEMQARSLALASPRVQAHLEGLEVHKVFYRQGRLINLVAR